MKDTMLSLKEKATQHWFSYFQNAPKYYNYFKTRAPVKYYF